MASNTEASFDNRSSHAPRLPLIGHGCLISPQPISKESTVRDDFGSWAVEVRERLQRALDAGQQPSLMDVAVLKQHIVIAIVTALQKDDRVSWLFLEEVLVALAPFRGYLQDKLEMHHYVARLLHHLNHNAERLFDLHVAETLRLVFSKEVEDVLEGNCKDKLMYNDPKYTRVRAPSTLAPLQKSRPKAVYKEEKDIFMLDRPEPPVKENGISLWDLSQSLPEVAFEVATREAVWNHCLGTTALALNTQLPLPNKRESPGATEQEQPRRQSPSELTDSSSTVSTARSAEPPVPRMTGRDAVEFFTRAYHTGKIKYMYFNIVHSRCYRPYDLIAVPKYKMEPEHYVFSTFGVLHVSPDYPSESMSLAEWQCDSVLFNAISKMAFFKNYLYRKMFTRWRGNVHFAHFARLRHSVRTKLLHTVPSFGGALLQAAKLCKEILALEFLPIDTKTCFKLVQLENFVRYRSVQATQLLDKFFSYQRQIVETTCTESFTKLQHCNKQVKHKAVFTRESLYLQRINSEEREKNLQETIAETRRLGNLVQLLDQLLLGHLVMIARDSVTRFVYETMKTSPDSSREALFEVKLIFPTSGMLTMSPPKEKFVTVLDYAFANIPTLLCESVLPLKGKLPGSKMLEEEDLEGSLSSSRISRMSSRASNLGRRSHQHVVPRSPAPNSTSPAGRKTARLSDVEEGVEKKETASATSRLGFIHTPIHSTEPLSSVTPDLMQERRTHDLEVLGVGFMGQYNPINSTNLREKLGIDEEYQEAIRVHHELMEAAINEVEDYCENNAWLNEINTYCNNWTEESVTQLEGAAAFTIEQKLNELRQWAERVRLFDHSYTTENSIFYVDCSWIHDCLIPMLDDICLQICSYIAVDAGERSIRFHREMKVVLENMKDKQTSMGGFAAYARNMNSYKSNIHNYHRTVDYIKSLFEVVRMSYRQLTPEEESLEASVLSSWDLFLFQLQDAMEFVNTQKPLITRNLDTKQQGDMTKVAFSSHQTASSISVLPEASVSVMDASQDVSKYLELEEEARDINTTATSGKFLDPTQDATEILTELKELRERFHELTCQMQQASKWKEAITGEPYDLDFLKDILTQMDLRQELWKYIEVSIHSIREWKTILFRKLQTKKIMDKLTEWQAAAGQMKSYFPVGDELLAFWYRELLSFKNELPLLHKLANDALKQRHWKAIFLSMGETYNPSHQFTVNELLSYNLRSHAQNINTIYAAALAEFAIERKLAKVRKQWNSQKFKLGQHIPDSLLKMDDSATDKTSRSLTTTSIQSKKSTRIEKFRQQKAPLSKQCGLDLRDSDLYILVDVNKLQYQIEDSQVTIQMMLTSQYLADHRQEAESWTHSLTELKELTELLHTCQINWLYLLKVFEEPAMYARLPDQSRQFTELHGKFTEMMTVISAEPRVMCIVSRRRMERGYRNLQGDRMRDLLISLISSEEEILKNLASLMDSSRTQFPRLYFLSNQELVELLSISRNPQGFLPFAQRCFPGIVGLNYVLPSEICRGTMDGGLLDFHLNGHQLEVTAMHGTLGEELPLVERLPAHTDATKWLSSLEQLMRTSLQTLIEECVIARFDGDRHQPLQLLEELAKFDEEPRSREATDLTMRIKASFSHWLMRFPSQCVLIAEAIVWERDTFRTLKKQDREELSIHRSQLSIRIGEYVKVLRENIICYNMSTVKERLHSLLGCLISQGLHHRDVMEKLLQNEHLSDSAFDWLKVLRMHMDVGSILRAKPKPAMSPVDEHAEGATESPTPQPSPLLGVKVNKATAEDLEHGLTAVASEYDFGQCSVSQMRATFNYNMEYIGPYTRLVFTPLTERACLTLTMALNSFSCGALMGPTGTGKSETIKDLAKMMGRHLVSFNCCEELKLPILNQFMNGMIQSGSWVLFDNIDRMSQGLLSVFGQHIESVAKALRAFNAFGDNHHGPIGTDRGTDPKLGDAKIRRNSVTTLKQEEKSTSPLERQATVPHGFNEAGLSTYFEDPWIKERDQRTDIEKEIPINESEMYRSQRLPPLFYEHVMRHRRPKRDFKELDPSCTKYRQSLIGDVMFNGHLVQASANFGCFMTMNTCNPASATIPDNLRLCVRPCAMIVPDKRVIIELQLYSNGVSQHVMLARKLCIFFDLLRSQLPQRLQYNYGLRRMCAVVTMATAMLEERLHVAFIQQQKYGSEKSSTPSPSTSPVEETSDTKTKLDNFDLNSRQTEEESVIDAIVSILLPTMAEVADQNTLHLVLRNVFPSHTKKKPEETKRKQTLITAIEDQLRQDNLQASQAFVDKILELYYALQLKQGILLTGMTGSGKSTCYSVLAKVMISLHNHHQENSTEDEGVLVHDLSLKKAHQEQKLKILKQCTPRQGKKQLTKLWKRVGSIHNAVNVFAVPAPVEDNRPDCANVNVDVVFPNVLPPSEMFGHFEAGVWHKGIITKIFHDVHNMVIAAEEAIKDASSKSGSRQAVKLPSIIRKWLVLDGDLHSDWVDNMTSLLDSGHALSLASGEQIRLHDTTSVIFELLDLTNASPSSITQCALVHCHPGSLSWKSLVESWMHMAKQRWVMSMGSLQLINGLVSSTFTNTINFLTTKVTTSLHHNTGYVRPNQSIPDGIVEVTSFLNIFSALLEKHLQRDELERKFLEKSQDRSGSSRSSSRNIPRAMSAESSIPNYLGVVKHMFAFAYIWGFGGNLHDSCMDKFDKFTRDMLRRASQPITVPESDSVFDYGIDCKVGQFVKWSEKTNDKGRSNATSYVSVAELERYTYLMDLLVNRSQPVLIVGETGVGKSSLIQNLVYGKHPYTKVAMEPGFTTPMLCDTVVLHMHELKTRMGEGGHQRGIPGGGALRGRDVRHLFFIDDLNAAPVDQKTGCQRPLELLRQMLTQKAVYNTQRQVLTSVEEAAFIAAATSLGTIGSGHGYTRHPFNERLTRLFAVITMFVPSTDVLRNIFTRRVLHWLEEFPTYTVDHLPEFAQALCGTLVSIYTAVKEKLRPTPTRPLYIFTLHNLSHVIEGVLLMSPRSKIKCKVKRHNKTESRGEAQIVGRGHEVAAPAGTNVMKVIVRLLCHECTRVFADRLVPHDVRWFDSLLMDTVKKHLCTAKISEKMITAAEGIPMTTSKEEPKEKAGDIPLGDHFPVDTPPEQPANEQSDTSSRPQSRSRTTSPRSATPTGDARLLLPSLQLPPPVERMLQQQHIPKGRMTLKPHPVSTSTLSHTTEGDSGPASSNDYSTTSSDTFTSTSDDDSTDSKARLRKKWKPVKKLKKLRKTKTSPPTGKKTHPESSSSTTIGQPSDTDAEVKVSTCKVIPTIVDTSQAPLKDQVCQPTGVTGSNMNVKVTLSRTVTRRGVSFKGDRDQERYYSPLLSMDQICDQDERLTDVIFTKGITPAASHTGERSYSESSVPVLRDALETCLLLYNQEAPYALSLVFFEEAVHHIARLTRVLGTQCGNALLLGTHHCSGRSTLVQLASFIARCQLFEAKDLGNHGDTRCALHRLLRQAGRSAGINNKPTVMLARDSLGEDVMMAVCAVMKEGTCAGLYTPEMIQDIATQMTPGHVKLTRLEKIENTFDKYLLRVRQNLHVIICLDTSGVLGGDLRTTVNKLSPIFNQVCHVDLYRPWSYRAYRFIALHWLKQPSFQHIPWIEDRRSEQMLLVANAMAYIHKSSMVALQQEQIHERAPRLFYTPTNFAELVHMFSVIGLQINDNESARIARYELGLKLIHEAFDTIHHYKDQVSKMLPRHHQSLTNVAEKVSTVESLRQHYMQALDGCKKMEMTIKKLSEPLEQLRKQSELEFNKVNPSYQAALETLNALDPCSLDEIRSYRVPPTGIHTVMDSLCLLFNVQPTWKSAKQLIIRDNFFQELAYYDKNNIPKPIFDRLGEICSKEDFTPQRLSTVSAAAAGLCQWVNAVHEYASVSRQLRSEMVQLRMAEDELTKAELQLGKQKVLADHIKTELESEIRSHKDCCTKAKFVEKQILVIERRINRCENIMANMTPQETSWKQRLKTARAHKKMIPCEALLAAASICYHGPLVNLARAKLMNEWLERCKSGGFDLPPYCNQKVAPLQLGSESDCDIDSSLSSSFIPVSQQTSTEVVSKVVGHDNMECVSSIQSLNPQTQVFRHQSSICDISMTVTTELRVAASTESAASSADLNEDVAMETGNLLDVRDDFTLQSILSTFQELSQWQLSGMPGDIHCVHDVLIMRACCYDNQNYWPCLLDPNNMAEMWVRALQKSPIQPRYPFVRVPANYTGAQTPLNDTIEQEVTSIDTGHSGGSSDSVTEETNDNNNVTSSYSFDAKQSGFITGSSSVSDTMQSGSTSDLTMTVHADEVVERPVDNVWVVAADDMDLGPRLINSVVHGITLLVTHVERQPLDPLYGDILHKKFSLDDCGRRVVKVGDTQLPIHDGFALYLSMSVPLSLEGDGLAKLPFHQMYVIDLTISQEATINHLLREIMKIERPEFEGQRRSATTDLICTQDEINKEEDGMLSKTLAMDGPLLEEKMMLPSLIEYQKNLSHSKCVLEESIYVGKLLDTKSEPYKMVATQGAKLYEIVQRMSMLNPLYFMSFDMFSKIFMSTIKARNRGSRCAGDPNARSQELINATTSAINASVCDMMFESHFKLFTLLATLERLRLSHQLNNEELGLFVNGIDTSAIDNDIVCQDKPDWLTDMEWLCCAVLESILPAFRGLCDSLMKHSQQWQEYFKCSVSLIMDLPGTALQRLSAFQKSLLWKICKPQKLWEVSEALVLYELGGVIHPAHTFNVEQIYKQCDRSIPVIFMSPSSIHSDAQYNSTKGEALLDPIYEVQDLAIEMGMEKGLRVVTCGVSTHSMGVQCALAECMQAGHWIILQNMHLAGEWDTQILQMFKMIVLSGSGQRSSYGDESTDDSSASSSGSANTERSSVKAGDGIHKNFRLWLTTQTDTGCLIPGILTQYSMKVSCEMTHNFKDTLRRIHDHTHKFFRRRDLSLKGINKLFGHSDSLVPLTVFHATLAQYCQLRQSAAHCSSHWTLSTQSVLLEQLNDIVNLCQQHKGVPEMAQVIYGGHCVDLKDRDWVCAVADNILLSPDKLTQLSASPAEVASLPQQLLLGLTQEKSFEEKLDDLVEVTGACMCSDVEAPSIQASSRNLHEDLLHVIGMPSLIRPSPEIAHSRAQAVLVQLQGMLQELPNVPRTNADGFYPMDLFLSSEVCTFQAVTDQIKTDVEFLLEVTKATTPVTSRAEQRLLTLSRGEIPDTWFAHTVPSSQPVVQWVGEMKARQETLRGYAANVRGAPLYDLAVFVRPDRFVHAVLQMYSRKEFKDLHSAVFTTQLLPPDAEPPQSPPCTGVYISGLHLHHASWDADRCVLTDQQSFCEKKTPRSKIPTVWLRPVDELILEEERAKKKNDSSDDNSTFSCPVFTTSDPPICGCNPVIDVNLPAEEPALWVERRVYMSTTP